MFIGKACVRSIRAYTIACKMLEYIMSTFENSVILDNNDTKQQMLLVSSTTFGRLNGTAPNPQIRHFDSGAKVALRQKTIWKRLISPTIKLMGNLLPHERLSKAASRWTPSGKRQKDRPNSDDGARGGRSTRQGLVALYDFSLMPQLGQVYLFTLMYKTTPTSLLVWQYFPILPHSQFYDIGKHTKDTALGWWWRWTFKWQMGDVGNLWAMYCSTKLLGRSVCFIKLHNQTRLVN